MSKYIRSIHTCMHGCRLWCRRCDWNHPDLLYWWDFFLDANILHGAVFDACLQQFWKILTFQFVHTDAVCHGLRFRDWGRVFLTWKDSQVLQLLFLTHHSRIRWAQDHCLCQYLQEGSSSQKPEQVGGPRKKLYVLWCTTVIFVKPCALMLITVSMWHIWCVLSSQHFSS